MNKMRFPQFQSCSCDVISPLFAYQDGGLFFTNYTLHEIALVLQYKQRAIIL